MTNHEYTYLMERSGLDSVPFKPVINCEIQLKNLIQIAVAQEREACALLVEHAGMTGEYGTLAIAALIRRRSDA